jgi:predicted dehydrogenase
MSAAPIRWGIAGPGWIGGRMTEALRTLPDAEVVAVGSRSADRAAEFASRHGIPRAHGSYDGLFADTDVDVVYLAGPHSTHRDHTLAALAAGRHVVCEKAFALDAVQAREMAAAARGAGLFLMEAMWTWFLPPIVEIRRRIAAGEIGRIRALRADFAIAVTGDDGRHRNADLGGGALLDLGVYPVSLAHLLLGPPRRVVALGETGPTGVDTNLGAILEHDDGAITTMYTGLDAPSGMTAEIVGTDGLIRLDPPFWCTETFVVDRHDAPPTRVEMPHAGLAHEAAHAMERIRSGELQSDVITLDQSIAVMETLDRIRAAMSDVAADDRG